MLGGSYGTRLISRHEGIKFKRLPPPPLVLLYYTIKPCGYQTFKCKKLEKN